MDTDALLDHLSDLAGIKPFYWDLFGGYHETSREAKQAILEAMGYATGSQVALAKSLRIFDEGPWRSMVEPVTVLRRPHPPTVRLTLPSRPPNRRVRWTIIQEDGTETGGDFIPGELSIDDARELDGDRLERRWLPLPEAIPDGYHQLVIKDGRKTARGRLIIAPDRAYLPQWIQRGVRRWGMASHVYALRRHGDWGMGDFTALKMLCQAGAKLGSSAIGVNPLHMLQLDRPEHASPYSPSSRLFLNPLYIDVVAAPGFGACKAARDVVNDSDFKDRLKTARERSHIDYAAASAMKLEVLETLFNWCECRRKDKPDSFRAFREERGEALHRFAIYQALREHFGDKSWRDWPKSYQRPDSPETAAFAKENAERVAFHVWMQWVAESQLQEAADVDMLVGLYRDLAVGADPDGADAWADPDFIVGDARFGAPPDAFNPLGQDWGMPPLHPHLLKERAYEPFIQMLRANMKSAGALRIDHVMSLMHLYWLRPGDDPANGAYVAYPFEDLLGILALESHRNECLVVGEDLGTVPDGFREHMEAEGILSHRLYYFERWENGLFKRPETYPALALATATTHDLPTIAGHWRGADQELRRRLGLFPSEEALEADRILRVKDRQMLLAALEDQGMHPAGLTLSPDTGEEGLRALTLAVERFLSRSPARLLMLNLDDLYLEPDQLNLPGTILEYPNWRRRLSHMVEDLVDDTYIRTVLRAVIAERHGLTPPLA